MGIYYFSGFYCIYLSELQRITRVLAYIGCEVFTLLITLPGVFMWILVYIFFILAIIIIYFIPKRLSKIEIYATTFFALFAGVTTDEILDIHYNLYGYFHEGFQWRGLIGSFLYFIPTSILFLNYFPLGRSILKKVMYILGCSIISVAIEWVVLQTEFFYHNGWKIWYSGLLYPLIYSMLIVNFCLVKKLSKQEK